MAYGCILHYIDDKVPWFYMEDDINKYILVSEYELKTTYLIVTALKFFYVENNYF